MCLVAGAVQRTRWPRRGDDEVHSEVVDGFGEGLVHHLEWVDRGGQHRVWPDHAGLDEEGDFEVGEASALADTSTLAVHGHAAADDQVHRWQFRRRDLPSCLGCAFLGGRLPGGDAQALWIQQVERQLLSQAGHRHVEDLALGEGSGADGSLRLVRVRLEHMGFRPRRQRRELLGGATSAPRKFGIFPTTRPGAFAAPSPSSYAQMRSRMFCLARSIASWSCSGWAVS